jgi:2-keto-4-pentenoate hydratase/2-oxohepta-3-ene-1,7-dioic acid hydratase in catechol pathway
MKFTRFKYKTEEHVEKIGWGIWTGDNIEVIDTTPFEKWERTGEVKKDFDVRFLAPCEPSKIICVGLNYSDHAEELKLPVPEEPIIFIKPSSSVLDPEGFIVKPNRCRQMDYEAELAVIIKKEAKNIEIEDVYDYILGYTCFNDITARDIQRKDGQWTRAKSFDTFAPIGPVVRTGMDPNNVKIELILNDKVVQSSNTSKMIFSMEKIVSFVSSVMTLYPGDLISCGTPPRVGSLGAGDVVEVVIEQIGSLRNYVTNEPIPGAK